MTAHAEIFDSLLVRLRSKIRGSVQLLVLESKDDHLAIQVGANPEALLGLRVKDSRRPSFHVSYPKLTVKKDGSRHIDDAQSEGVVADGVEWIVCQLAEHGVVMPEFVD